jgi:hypothetical protein
LTFNQDAIKEKGNYKRLPSNSITTTKRLPELLTGEEVAGF